MASSPVMRDRRGFADGVWIPDDATVPQPKVVSPAAWEGPALIGHMGLDATVGDWSTTEEQDYRWTATIHPHFFCGNDPGSEVLFAFDSGTTYFVKVYFSLVRDGDLVGDEGDVLVGIEWGDGATATATWLSDVSVGDWQTGAPRADYRLTVDPGVSGTYVFTVYKDGVVVDTDTETGMDPFLPPPAATPLIAGNVTGHAVALHTMDMLDGIDGDPLYSFDAAAPAGWSADNSTLFGAIYSAPTHPSFLTSNLGNYQVPDPAVFDIAADSSVTWVWRFTPRFEQADYHARNRANLGVGEVWFLLDNPGAGIDHKFIVGDGSVNVPVDVGVFIPDVEQTVSVTLDRSDDTLTSYRNGVQVAVGDATGLGAVAPDEPVEVGIGHAMTAFAGFARRALTPAEHLTLHYELAAA